MTISTAWEVNNMVHNIDNGGVRIVYWRCVAEADTGESAVESGKLRFEPNPSSPDYVAYESLTEKIVLGWVYRSLIKGEETAGEAKTRIEVNRTNKVEAQIARNSGQASGIPWNSRSKE